VTEPPAHAQATDAAQDVALCFNAGSSSLKFALFRVDEQSESSLASGMVERLATPEARATVSVGGSERERAVPNAGTSEALDIAFDLLEEERLPRATVVGHRVVHGGRAHVRPTRVDAALLESLRGLVPMAPLHLPAGIKSMEAALARLPSVPHVACFDTAFHAGMPEYAARYALPTELYEDGVRRYGFHGLSYEFVLSTLGKFPPNRIIIAHLGSGASLVAVREGR
jgi:acetate kinase